MAASNTIIYPHTLKFFHSGSSSAQIIESILGFTDLLKALLDSGNEQKFYRFIESHVDFNIDSLFREEKKQIESELENVEGVIDIADKRREIHKRYRDIAENDPRLKEIAATLDDVFTKVMEELETKLKENDGGGGYT